jgi:proteasome lid subunit RPN8/RPN11
MNPLCFRKKQPSSENTQVSTRPEETTAPSPEPASEEISLFERTRLSALSARDDILRVVSEGIGQGSRTPLEEYLESLWFLTDVVKVTHEAGKSIYPLPPSPVPSQATAPAIASYVINAKFLADCYAFLTSQPNGYERLHLVSGSRLSPTQRTLDYMSKVALDAQSEFGARANDPSLRQALMELDTWGMALYALFHSHPGEGASHTRPSSIDLATHERYERRYPVVGCIFVRDGFLRFFRHSAEPFSITLFGTGIVPVAEDEHVYKIETGPRCVSYETIAGRY